jgi:hypothetical protein
MLVTIHRTQEHKFFVVGDSAGRHAYNSPTHIMKLIRPVYLYKQNYKSPEIEILASSLNNKIK